VFGEPRDFGLEARGLCGGLAATFFGFEAVRGDATLGPKAAHLRRRRRGKGVGREAVTQSLEALALSSEAAPRSSAA
jgi:hypothetical protein